MTGKKQFKGYLDRLRENVEVLDEAVATARKMSKPKGKGDKAAALQWAKTVANLVELRNATLGNIKAHMNGRDESGAVCEPPEVYDENSQVEFEREFRNLMQPWTADDLKLKCEDCGVESEEVEAHPIWHTGKDGYKSGDSANLCAGCYEKRPDKRER